MEPQPVVTIPPLNRSRMMLMVLGTGAAVGLHLGLLHAFMWRTVGGPVAFFLGSLAFSAVTYGLWRWIFPRLTGRSFGSQVTKEIVVSLIVYGVLSTLVVSVGCHFLGIPQLFGTPTGD